MMALLKKPFARRKVGRYVFERGEVAKALLHVTNAQHRRMDQNPR
jgi:hypothetical protein